ncbi:PucR family transcriptional regulator [Janibacter sp. G56]|uniref:PucR family transcriptional regulator n=1 Tax=Janibacter sp. G56 TaxID=3418717 RepID=UPI003D076AB3
MIALADLTAALAGGLLTVVVPGTDAPIDDLTLAELDLGIVGVAGDLVLGVAVDRRDAALDLVTRSAAAGAGGVVLRKVASDLPAVRDRARQAGIALVELAENASWAHVVWLLRGILDRSGAVPVDDTGDDLFAVADAAAALVDGPVTIEDARSRVLAYSARQDEADPARVSTIVGRRVPEEVLGRLRARGVFRHLARSAEPLLVAGDRVLGPRLVVPVRAGGEWLGSIWVATSQLPPEPVLAELTRTASVVALHLLRLRARSDLTRRVSADRLRTALTGGDLEAQTWLPEGPWRIAALGVPGDAEGPVPAGGGPAARADAVRTDLDLWEAVCRRHGWQQPLLTDIDDRVIALVRAEGPATTAGTWTWLKAVAEDPGGVALTAAASGPVRTVGDLPAAAADAREVLGLLLPGGPSAAGATAWVGAAGPALAKEDAWVALTLMRSVRGIGDGPAAAPVAALQQADAVRGTELVATLAAWLDHPGESARAARALHVHPNTVRYRLQQVESVLEAAGLAIDLGDPPTRLALRLQLLVARPPR